MTKTTTILLAAAVTAAAVLSIPTTATAHGGGLASDGCHNQRATGTRHCHNSAKDIKRRTNNRAKRDFRAANPCPATGKTTGSCPGYHIDHINPRACGGADAVYNMQWLTAHANLSKGSMGCRYGS